LKGTSMRMTVLSISAMLALLSQPAASQAIGTTLANAAIGQANAAIGTALGRANATLGALGITPGLSSIGIPGPVGGSGSSAPGSGSVSGGSVSAPPSPAAPASAGAVGVPATGVVSSGAATSFVSASPASLPTSLHPLELSTERSSVYWSDMGVLTDGRPNLQALRGQLRNRQGGTASSIVQSCRNAVAASALPYGAVGLDTAAAGPVRSTPTGYRVTIAARVLYSRPGGSQVRQASFTCQLNQAGQVVAMR